MANAAWMPPGPAVGLGARLVGDDVVADEVEVGTLVERGGGLHHERRAQPRQAARIHPVGAVDGDEPAVLAGADLDVDHARPPPARAALQHLLAREHDLHGPPALLRQPHRRRLAVDGDLAAEAAADLERHHLELRRGQPEHGRDHQLGRELSLRGGPHRGKAVGVDLGHHHLRLEIALVRRVDPHARPRLARACPSAACVSPRPITVREHRLLGVFGLGSTPLVSTCSCSTGSASASAASMSSTAGSGS